MRVALFGKNIDANSMAEFAELMSLLNSRQGVEWSFYSPFYQRYKEMVKFPSGSCFRDYSDLNTDTDLLLSLGGDGTILESLTLVRDKMIPVAGINFGRLGFLTTESVDDKNLWIEQLLESKFAVKKRTLLKVGNDNLTEFTSGTTSTCYPFALNEVSIAEIRAGYVGNSCKDRWRTDACILGRWNTNCHCNRLNRLLFKRWRPGSNTGGKGAHHCPNSPP